MGGKPDWLQLRATRGAATLLDAAVVRRKWDAGIKAFFNGLKRNCRVGTAVVSADGGCPVFARV